MDYFKILRSLVSPFALTKAKNLSETSVNFYTM